jgi:uncharacterized protein
VSAPDVSLGVIRPAPVPDEDSLPFWQGLAERRLQVQACLHCGEVRCPPLPACPRCGATVYRWQDASGRGRIYSWVVARRAIGGLDESELPRTIATVELDEGCRVIGRLTDFAEPDFDQVVSAQYLEHPGWTELAFTRATPAHLST